MKIDHKLKIPLSNPDLTKKEINAVLNTLKTPNLSLGPKISEFERILAEFPGVKYAIVMSSGTAVLHTIIKALGIFENNYVLTTPFSFISSSNCLLFEGAKPIFVDIDEDTYNITPNAVEKDLLSLPENIKEKVNAIIYVDVFGVPADGKGFEKLGKKHNLHIIEDSAEALGSSINGRKCGSFGDAGLFAFYPNKQITTGEGGVLLTNNDKLAKIAKSLRNQGRDEKAEWLQHTRLGYNYRISDINATLGIAQMKRVDEIVSKRRKVKEIYDKYLEDFFKKGILIPQKALSESYVSPFVYVVRLANKYSREDRDLILDKVREKGIGCSNYFTPIHLQPFYRKMFGYKKGDFPITEKVSERTIALPFYNNLKEEQIDYICENLKKIIQSPLARP